MIYAKALAACLAVFLASACGGAVDVDPELLEPGSEESALSGPGAYASPTSLRPSVGKIDGCPVLWLTETYAVTVAHCADQNSGLSAGSFDAFNIATVSSGVNMKLRDVNGTHERTNAGYKVKLHDAWPAGSNDPDDGINDIAIYMITSQKWSIATTGDVRALIYNGGLTWPHCLDAGSNTAGFGGAATWYGGFTNKRQESVWKHCEQSVTGYDGLVIFDPELRNGTEGRYQLPYGKYLDYDMGDSGGAAYMTTTNSRRPAYYGLISAGLHDDNNNEFATGLQNKNTWIKAQDTALGGPAISSWLTTMSLGPDNSISVRYYTDSSE